MQKWEYLEVITVFGTVMRIFPSKGKSYDSSKGDKVPEFKDYWDSLGREGWEIVNITRDKAMNDNLDIYFFKRPIE